VRIDVACGGLGDCRELFLGKTYISVRQAFSRISIHVGTRISKAAESGNRVTCRCEDFPTGHSLPLHVSNALPPPVKLKVCFDGDADVSLFRAGAATHGL
jgi:hypothetical protein